MQNLSNILAGIYIRDSIYAAKIMKESVLMLKWTHCGLETPLNDRLFLFSPYVRDLPLRFREATLRSTFLR